MVVSPLNLPALQTITTTDIQNVLAYLAGRVVGPPSEKLYHLCAVDHFLANGTQSAPANRQEALFDLLLSLIIEGLINWRAKYGFTDLPPDPSPKEARQILARHGRKKNPWLIGYTYLHFMYLRSDLEIPEQEFAERCGVSRQQLRQCEQKALDQLLQRIMVEELSWRVARHQN